MSASPSETPVSDTPMPPAPVESVAPTPAKTFALLMPSSRSETWTVPVAPLGVT